MHGGNRFILLKRMDVSGIGEMVFCEGRINNEKYMNVLETGLMSPLPHIFSNTDLNGVKF